MQLRQQTWCYKIDHLVQFILTDFPSQLKLSLTWVISKMWRKGCFDSKCLILNRQDCRTSGCRRYRSSYAHDGKSCSITRTEYTRASPTFQTEITHNMCLATSPFVSCGVVFWWERGTFSDVSKVALHIPVIKIVLCLQNLPLLS